jgi:hypothetical protein
MKLLTFRCKVLLFQVYRQPFHQPGDGLELGCIMLLAGGSAYYLKSGDLPAPERVPKDAMIANEYMTQGNPPDRTNLSLLPYLKLLCR